MGRLLRGPFLPPGKAVSCPLQPHELLSPLPLTQGLGIISSKGPCGSWLSQGRGALPSCSACAQVCGKLRREKQVAAAVPGLSSAWAVRERIPSSFPWPLLLHPTSSLGSGPCPQRDVARGRT